MTDVSSERASVTSNTVTGSSTLSSVPLCMKAQCVTKIRAQCWGSDSLLSFLKESCFWKSLVTQGSPLHLGTPCLWTWAGPGWDGEGALLGRALLPESDRSLSCNCPVPGSRNVWQPWLCTWQTHHTGEWRHLTRSCLQGKHLQPQANWPLPGSSLMVCRLQWGSLIKQPACLPSRQSAPRWSIHQQNL